MSIAEEDWPNPQPQIDRTPKAWWPNPAMVGVHDTTEAFGLTEAQLREMNDRLQKPAPAPLKTPVELIGYCNVTRLKEAGYVILQRVKP